jgi:hypothetical protein
VESYFLRANDPERPRALWLKATILAPFLGEPVAETWCIWFDGERNRTWARKTTLSLRDATFPRPPGQRITIGDVRFQLGPDGMTQGVLQRGDTACSWDLGWTRGTTPVAEPLSIFPHPALVEGPFPKSKLLTPFPALSFAGRVECFGESVDIAGWHGMQGHNWGREHAWEYAWGQCLFAGENGAPEAMVEGFTGRIRLAGRTTPRLSALVVRRGGETFRFDRVFDFWRQDARIDDFSWQLTLQGTGGTARLRLNAAGRPIVCLGYLNPDGRLSYCFNSKLAETTLEVTPPSGRSFKYRSAHGGALEFLRNEPDPRITEVV